MLVPNSRVDVVFGVLLQIGLNVTLILRKSFLDFVSDGELIVESDGASKHHSNGPHPESIALNIWL